MTRSAGGPAPRHFGIDEAERTLPLVERIVADIVEENRVLAVLLPELRLSRLRARRAAAGAPPPELERLRSEVARTTARLESCPGELKQLGCSLHDPDGTVDFPFRIGEHTVSLCWRLGEDSIRHWHPAGERDRERRLLPAALLAAGTGPDRDG